MQGNVSIGEARTVLGNISQLLRKSVEEGNLNLTVNGNVLRPDEQSFNTTKAAVVCLPGQSLRNEEYCRKWSDEVTNWIFDCSTILPLPLLPPPSPLPLPPFPLPPFPSPHFPLSPSLLPHMRRIEDKWKLDSKRSLRFPDQRPPPPPPFPSPTLVTLWTLLYLTWVFLTFDRLPTKMYDGHLVGATSRALHY